MHPYLFDLMINGHRVRIPSFGFFLALATSSSYFWSLRNAPLFAIDFHHIEKLFLVVLGSSALGMRLFHVFFEEPGFYFSNPVKIFAVWEGGYTLYGGILAALGAIFIYCRRNALSFWTVLDIASISTMLGISIGRMGCFFAGCCWGKLCHLPWAVTYTHPEAFNTLKYASVHPVQIYESLGALMCFYFLQRKVKKRKFPGEIGLTAVIGYGILRFLVEYFRGDSYRGFIIEPWISYSQFISILMILAALSGLAALSRTSHSST